MLTRAKLYIFSYCLSFIALLSILLAALGSYLGHVILTFNPILSYLFHSGHLAIVDTKQQALEAGSFIIHFNVFGYLIHFLSILIIGLLLDFCISRIWRVTHTSNP